MNTSVANFNMRDLSMKYKGEVLITAALFYIVIVILLLAAAAMQWGTIRDFFRSGAQRIELSSMASAASTYSALRADGAAPVSAADLINGVAAADSIDGMAHTGLMNGESGRWKNGTYNDIWGNAFQFTTENGARKIVSAGPDGEAGNDDDIEAYY